MVDKKPISIFFHNYYGKHEEWVRSICDSMPSAFDLYYNVVVDSPYLLQTEQECLSERLRAVSKGSQLRRMHLRYSPNKGKDVGGKLVLFDAFLRNHEAAGYGLLIHDKQSPQKQDGSAWSRKLLRVMEKDFAIRALRFLDQSADTGIVAASGTILRQVNGLAARTASLHTILPGSGDYVAGTMFWFRIKAWLDFFTVHSPLEIRRSLERGNIMDEDRETETHAWERCLSWISLAGGMKISEQE